MASIIKFVRKGGRILYTRLREQGAVVTGKWAYARGYTKLTGVPSLSFCRITPQIYIGGQHNAHGRALLEQHSILYDVNMRDEYDDAAHGVALPHYCYLPTIDDTAPSFEQLWQGVHFIQDAVRAGGKVYIHCAGGIGRAPTMGAAYLMSTGLSLDEALTQIKRVRPFINIMPPQMDALRAFEAMVREKQQP